MADVLIRGLSEAAVARIDAEAASHGLSRNEFLRRRFEAERPPHRQPENSPWQIFAARRRRSPISMTRR